MLSGLSTLIDGLIVAGIGAVVFVAYKNLSAGYKLSSVIISVCLLLMMFTFILQMYWSGIYYDIKEKTYIGSSNDTVFIDISELKLNVADSMLYALPSDLRKIAIAFDGVQLDVNRTAEDLIRKENKRVSVVIQVHLQSKIDWIEKLTDYIYARIMFIQFLCIIIGLVSFFLRPDINKTEVKSQVNTENEREITK